MNERIKRTAADAGVSMKEISRAMYYHEDYLAQKMRRRELTEEEERDVLEIISRLEKERMDEMSPFARRLLHILRCRGWTIAEFAARAGKKPSTVRNYLNNRARGPSLETAAVYARVSGVSLDWLAGMGPNTRIPLTDSEEWIKEEAP